MKRKSILVLICLLLVFSFAFVGCQQQPEAPEAPEETEEETQVEEGEESAIVDGTYTAEAPGYGGPLKLTVTVEGEKLTDITVDEHQETMPVYTRALPVIEARILEAQTPVVDSVTGATFTSFAVKKAVGEALNEAGMDIEEIYMDTQGSEVEKKELENEETDLVIIGGGPAGLSAAIQAHDDGVDNIIVLEKLDILGGNGKFDMIIFDGLNMKAQKDAGVEYTKDEFIAAKEGNPQDSPERIQAWADGAYELDEWFRSMGIELNHTYDGKSHLAEADAYAGEEILDGLEAKIAEIGTDVRTGNKVYDLIMEDGECKGVKVETKEGTYEIRAKATLVATGGFSQNKELLAEYHPGAEKLNSSNSMGATGDLIPVFIENDIALDHMDILKIFNPMITKNRELTGARGDGFLLINGEGKRFIAENTKDELNLGLTILDQPGGVFYVYDQPVADSFYRMEKHIKLGYHTVADTLEELAEELGIDPDNLKETVENYNKAVRGEQADEFREELGERPFAEEGPYYGVKIESAVHMTKGGVVANERTEVLNTDGNVVPGLYAAGEVTDTSGIFKEAFIFGRIAGAETAKYIQQ